MSFGAYVQLTCSHISSRIVSSDNNCYFFVALLLLIVKPMFSKLQIATFSS